MAALLAMSVASTSASAHARAASHLCCPGGIGHARSATTSSKGTRTQLRPAAVQQRRHRRRSSLQTAASKAKAEPKAAPAPDAGEAPEAEGASPIEETSDESPFADLMQRARSAIESGSQADQDQVLQEIDTQLTVSAAKAEAADAQLLAVQGDVEASQDKFLRINAEFDNFRKRSTKEKDDAVSKAKARVIEDLLPVVDAFESAAGQVKAETEGEQRIAASYQGLYAKMVDAFKKMGLEVVPGVGTPFDPEVHEAIMRAPSEEHPDGTVLQEFRRGFTIGGHLLRPAMVQVSYSDEQTAERADEVTQKAANAGDTPEDTSEEGA